MSAGRAAAASFLALILVALSPGACARPSPQDAVYLNPARHGARERSAELRRVLVRDALRLLGAPYRRGGDSPRSGFDCSGLVDYVFAEAAGIALPHSTRDLSRQGRHVPRRRLEVGDLVFFHTRRARYSHVGIYLGRGRFIHAPRPGSRVRISSLRDRYWRRHFSGARRVLRGRGPARDDGVAAANGGSGR